MTVQVKNRDLTTVVTKNESAIFGNNKYQGFQAPFSERRAILLLGDTLLVLLAVWVAFVLGQYTTTNHPFNAATIMARISARWYWFPILLGGWWVLAWLNDLYDIPSSSNKILNTGRVAIAGGMSLFIYLAVFFLIPEPIELPRLFFLYFLLVISLTIILWRWTYATLSNLLPLQHRVLIVGGGARGRSLACVLNQDTKLNYRVLGYVDDAVISGLVYDDLPVWGRASDLSRLTRQLQVHEIVVAIERDLEKDLFQCLIECQANGVRVSLLPDLYEKLYRKIPIEHIDPSWALHVIQDRPVFNRLQLAVKRLLDLGLVLVGLPFLMLVLPVVALAIRLDSPGPIFYYQTRCGRAGKPFSIFKFRTMSVNAEKDGQARWATQSDSRITRVGRFLRKTRLDELPQLLNVLRGEMSLVGPRPERPEFVEMLQQEIPFYRTRLMVKPGLTGWAQIHYDYGNSVEDALTKLQYDFYYLRYWSVWLDLYTIFQTFAVVFKFKGI
ncbi:MAG: sugar transferase [Chloroflexi bacterium]|nr:sugar transferase [Chloroflexota bacterium]